MSSSPNYMTSDPRALADEVADRELVQAIAWTEFFLESLRCRQRRPGADLADLYRESGPTRIPDADIARLNDDSDVAQSLLDIHREADTLDINLSEQGRLIGEQRRLASAAMRQFHALHDAETYDADDDGHFDRQGHVQERRGL